jgi:endonuclease G
MESSSQNAQPSRKKYWLILITLCLIVTSLILISVAIIKQARFRIYPGDRQNKLLKEHVYRGLPCGENIYFRQGYILCYDEDHRVPKWVAYHIIPDYMNTPERAGKFEKYGIDPEISYPVDPDDYAGLYQSELNLARGHLAPYAVMGGDRDGDGLYAEDDDEYDIKTLTECNYMSNMAPQNQRNFNGPGGLWYKLERWIQDSVVKAGGDEVWIFAGCVFDENEPEYVGPAEDIAVPPMFFKIVIRENANRDEPRVLAFLFPHQYSRQGEIQDFLTTVDSIEALTQLDFFNELNGRAERELESTGTKVYWKNFRRPLDEAGITGMK